MTPPALGTHFSIYPSDWGAANYWRAFAIRPSAADHDLSFYTASLFDNPGARTLLTQSAYGTGQVDLILTDGNHRLDQSEHYRAYNYSGAGTYAASWSNQRITLPTGCSGPYSMTSNEVVKIFDVLFAPYQVKKISIVPNNGLNDLGAALFRSDSNVPSTWVQNRGQAVVAVDAYGVGSNVEQLIYSYSASISDYLGLAVYSNVQAAASFNVCIENLSPRSFLPLIQQ